MGENAGAVVGFDDMDLTIQLPARKWPPTMASVTPGRSLTASVLGRGPTLNIRDIFTIDPRPLGEGQYGKVFICTENSTGQRYACKTISRSSLISVEDVEDVRTEVNILNHLQNKPNIVKIRGSFEDRHDIHIVMEFCAGGELFDELNRRTELRGVPYRILSFSERDAAKLCKAVVKALHSCHGNGVIHRDLKPENFLLTSTGKDAILKAADFGLATFFQPGQRFTRVCGSCMYMSPEVCEMWENSTNYKYDQSVDIWAAGVIMYILISGAYPFMPPGKDRSERAFRRTIIAGKRLFTESVWQSVSPSAKDLIGLMLTRDPDKRPSAEKVLGHPWIECAPDEPLERDVVNRFKKFLYVIRLKKVKKVALRVISQSLDEEQIVSLRTIISEMDVDCEGVVPVRVLSEMLRKLDFLQVAKEIEDMIQEVCLDDSVPFDYTDFFVALLQLTQIERQENLFKAFAVYDQDLSGYISSEELRLACSKYKVHPDVVREMMTELARDETGRVDYNEFVAMMRLDAGGISRKAIERQIDQGSYKEVMRED